MFFFRKATSLVCLHPMPLKNGCLVLVYMCILVAEERRKHVVMVQNENPLEPQFCSRAFGVATVSDSSGLSS